MGYDRVEHGSKKKKKDPPAESKRHKVVPHEHDSNNDQHHARSHRHKKGTATTSSSSSPSTTSTAISSTASEADLMARAAMAKAKLAKILELTGFAEGSDSDEDEDDVVEEIVDESVKLHTNKALDAEARKAARRRRQRAAANDSGNMKHVNSWVEKEKQKEKGRAYLEEAERKAKALKEKGKHRHDDEVTFHRNDDEAEALARYEQRERERLEAEKRRLGEKNKDAQHEQEKEDDFQRHREEDQQQSTQAPRPPAKHIPRLPPADLERIVNIFTADHTYELFEDFDEANLFWGKNGTIMLSCVPKIVARCLQEIEPEVDVTVPELAVLLEDLDVLPNIFDPAEQPPEAALLRFSLGELVDLIAECMYERQKARQRSCQEIVHVKSIFKSIHYILICIAMFAEIALDVSLLTMLQSPLSAEEATSTEYLRQHLPFYGFEYEMPLPTNGEHAQFFAPHAWDSTADQN